MTIPEFLEMEQPHLLYVVAVVLAIAFRYQLGLMEACKTVGVRISSSSTKTGFQDAITPPWSTNFALVIWASILALFGYTVVQFGWSQLAIVAGTFLIWTIVTGALFIPKPDSAHYLKLIYGSMDRRYADYKKHGDVVRADAILELARRVERAFGDRLT